MIKSYSVLFFFGCKFELHHSCKCMQTVPASLFCHCLIIMVKHNIKLHMLAGCFWLYDPLCYAVNAHEEIFVTSCIWDLSLGKAGKRVWTTQLIQFESSCMFLESVLAVGFVTSCTCGLFQEICGELFGGKGTRGWEVYRTEKRGWKAAFTKCKIIIIIFNKKSPKRQEA